MMTKLMAASALAFGLVVAGAQPSSAAPRGGPMSGGMKMSYVSTASATRYGQRAPMVRKAAKSRAVGWCGR